MQFTKLWIFAAISFVNEELTNQCDASIANSVAAADKFVVHPPDIDSC